MSDANETYPVALFTLSSAVFAQRSDEILILKRTGGEAAGGWYLPGGNVDHGETVEASARRELLEEARLTPAGPLTCVAVAHMHVYGRQSLQVFFSCDCPSGDIVLSAEHSDARWVDPIAFRDSYFSSDIVTRFAASDERIATMVANIRAAFDSYLDWRRLQAR